MRLRSGNGRRIAIGVFVVLILSAAAWWYARSAGTSAAAPSPPAATAVKAVKARRDTVPRYVSTAGTVQAFNTVAVRTRVDGQIQRVPFREGQDVRQADILVELDARPFEAQLRAAIAQEGKDRAQLDNAKRDLERYEFLAETDSGPRQQLDTTRALVRQLEASVDADKAQVDAARLQVQYATIRAPFDGRVGARLIDAGNMVHPGDASPLVMLTQVRPAAVTFSVTQDVLPALRTAMRQGPLHVTALSKNGAETLDEGTLTVLDNQVDPATGTIRCKAIFANANEALWPGQFVSARIQLGTFRDAIVVPASAVQNGPAGTFVYVVHEGVAQLRPVSVATTTAQSAVVERGLSEGEPVVTEGQFQIEPGARVSIAP